MTWNIVGFTYELWPQVQRYHDENGWVTWWTQEDIWNCWRMYKTASASSLGFLLLGDTKIRKDESLLMNFGTTTAHNIQEEAERKTLERLAKERNDLSRNTQNIKYPAPKGPGSILSDDKWTPMLNVSFMLGGIHSGAEFHLAEELFFSIAGTVGGTSEEKWKYFFQNNKASLWDVTHNIPRVFARECVGLKTAGYKPFFSDHSLIFRSPGPSKGLTFEKYLTAISTSGLTANDKTLAIQNVAEFLFNDQSYLKY